MTRADGRPIEERGWLRLIGAILIQAMKDFQKSKDVYLKAWLLRDGPLYLQGDHTSVRYRNVSLSPRIE